MKILLINPPNSGRSIPEEQYGIETVKLIFRGEPLALEVLAGNLNGQDVRIADLKVRPDSLEAELADLAPDLVGITGMTCEANAVLKIAEMVRDQTGATVAVGGHYASADPPFFNHPAVDYVVVGLGKASFAELVAELETGGDPGEIPGVARTRPGGEIQWTPRRFSPADLVDNRAPRYDLVACHRDQYVMSGVGGKTGYVVSAHGCTHHCTFCCVPSVTGGRYLAHSPEAVVRDIGLLGEVPAIRLADANTFGDPVQAEALAHRLLDAGLDKRIVADVRADTVVRHPELFELWRQAGLAAAVIGFEEISDEGLRVLGKGCDTAANHRAVEILKGLGIRIIGDFIVSPDYTEADFDRLERYIGDMAIDLPIPAVLTPLPGTPLFRRLRDRITVTDLDYYTFTNAVVPTRLPERTFYEVYSGLLGRCLARGHQPSNSS